MPDFVWNMNSVCASGHVRSLLAREAFVPALYDCRAPTASYRNLMVPDCPGTCVGLICSWKSKHYRVLVIERVWNTLTQDQWSDRGFDHDYRCDMHLRLMSEMTLHVFRGWSLIWFWWPKPRLRCTQNAEIIHKIGLLMGFKMRFGLVGDDSKWICGLWKWVKLFAHKKNTFWNIWVSERLSE